MTVEEFKSVIMPLSAHLYSVAYRMLSNTDDAKDALQDLLVKLWQMRDKIDTSINLKAYATVMMRNACYDRFRTKKIDVDDSEIELFHSLQSDENLEKTVENRDVTSILLDMIQELPPNQRSVIEMRDLSGMEIIEIAKSMNIEQGNVRVLLSRARKSLKNKLTQIINYERKTS